MSNTNLCIDSIRNWMLEESYKIAGFLRRLSTLKVSVQKSALNAFVERKEQQRNNFFCPDNESEFQIRKARNCFPEENDEPEEISALNDKSEERTQPQCHTTTLCHCGHQ